MKSLDAIDREIITLISERVRAYGDRIRNEGSGIPSPFVEREAAIQVIDSMKDLPLGRDVLITIFNEIIFNAYQSVKPVRVAYLGPPGTFSNLAQLDIFGSAVEQAPMKTIYDVFHEVEVGNAAYGVVPVENSTEGTVTFTMDELMETDLKIVAERYIRITFSLLSRQQGKDGVRRVYTHPQPWGQCKEWLRVNLPDVEIHQVDSTSRAAELAAGDPESAAISSRIAGELYQLNTLATRIEDSRLNITRFYAVGREENPPTGHDKTSIVCTVRDRPAALLELLRPLSEGGINMTKIESRPDKKRTWEYNFFIDFLGHRDDPAVMKVIDEIRNRTVFLKILGSYPVSDR
jgi:chorismate mutase / prephenate dehydratase